MATIPRTSKKKRRIYIEYSGKNHGAYHVQKHHSEHGSIRVFLHWNKNCICIDVATEVFGIKEISAETEVKKPPKKADPEPHELNAKQQQQLDVVRKSLMSFEEYGLR